MDKNKLFNTIEKKTNVSKDDIFSLAKSLQTKDLTKESNIRDLIDDVSKMAGKSVSKEKADKIVNIIQNNKVPKDLNNIL